MIRLSMKPLPFAPTPEGAKSGPTVGKWVVSVNGTPFCIAHLFASPNELDLERWWVIPPDGKISTLCFIGHNRKPIGQATLIYVRLTDWIRNQVIQREVLERIK